MTDHRKSNYENGGYISGKMVNDLSPRKSMIVLVIVVGCFAVLWPKVFYPMLVGSANNKIKPSAIDRTQGCCDVISEKDVNTIKLMSDICSTIIQKTEDTSLSNKELVLRCRSVVLETCGIDISAVLQEKVKLGKTTRQILDEIRSLNGSLCLKYNFGVSPFELGVPHRVTVKMSSSYSIRQERPQHLRSEMLHPAFRERGRAIPQSESFAPTKPSPPSRVMPKIINGRPGPLPGMRPTIGGAGHVVPPSKHGGNTMGLIMPIYTIGIVVFFTYTVMKIAFRKQPEVLYPSVDPDPQFRREVFEADRGHLGSKLPKESGSSKLVVNAMSALLDEVDMELSSRRKTSTSEAEQDVVTNANVGSQEDDQGSVQVLGMETTASCEGGQKWTRSGSPVITMPNAHPQPPPEPVTPPQEIFLEGALPPQSHLLVTDSATEAQEIECEADPAVVLAGKMTLSVISLDSTENGTDESSASSRKHCEDRSSSNVSEEFEKIDVAQLEEQIAADTSMLDIALVEEKDASNLEDTKILIEPSDDIDSEALHINPVDIFKTTENDVIVDENSVVKEDVTDSDSAHNEKADILNDVEDMLEKEIIPEVTSSNQLNFEEKNLTKSQDFGTKSLELNIAQDSVLEENIITPEVINPQSLALNEEKLDVKPIETNTSEIQNIIKAISESLDIIEGKPEISTAADDLVKKESALPVETQDNIKISEAKLNENVSSEVLEKEELLEEKIYVKEEEENVLLAALLKQASLDDSNQEPSHNRQIKSNITKESSPIQVENDMIDQDTNEDIATELSSDEEEVEVEETDEEEDEIEDNAPHVKVVTNESAAAGSLNNKSDRPTKVEQIKSEKEESITDENEEVEEVEEEEEVEDEEEEEEEDEEDEHGEEATLA